MTEYITKKDKKEDKPQYITKKKKKIDLGKIVSEAINKQEDKPQYITLKNKKQKPFITKKSPQEIREREMIRSKKMGGGMMGRRFGMKKGSKFPDLTGDGKVTFADILKGRGVINGKKKKK